MMRFVILAALITVFPVVPAFGQTAHIDLAWDPTTTPDVDDYNIYVGTSPSAQDVGVYTVPGSQTNYTFAATPGVLYYFSVTAVNAAGEGPRSASISGSIPLLVSLVNRTSTVSVPIVALRLTAEDPDGGVVRFTHTGLPPGLVLESVTGLITGIPLNTGTFRVTVFASDGVLS